MSVDITWLSGLKTIYKECAVCTGITVTVYVQHVSHLFVIKMFTKQGQCVIVILIGLFSCTVYVGSVFLMLVLMICAGSESRLKLDVNFGFNKCFYLLAATFPHDPRTFARYELDSDYNNLSPASSPFQLTYPCCPCTLTFYVIIRPHCYCCN